MNKKIRTSVFAHIPSSVLVDRTLSQSTNNYRLFIENQMSRASFARVLIEDVLASVSFMCSSSVMVKVE